VRRQISDEERKERTQGRPHRAVVVPGTSELCLDQLSQTAAGATCVEQHMAISCVSAAVGLAPGRAQPHSSHPLLSFVCGSSGCTVFGSCPIVESDAGEEGEDPGPAASLSGGAWGIRCRHTKPMAQPRAQRHCRDQGCCGSGTGVRCRSGGEDLGLATFGVVVPGASG
jgi:hypothetical protein